ncbi:hypothetical protein DFH06DRAFT_1224809 [Mycena polygramma]|nr:hypothetical protein DFH06DRAFT_1224809 [Mycena polygramma]
MPPRADNHPQHPEQPFKPQVPDISASLTDEAVERFLPLYADKEEREKHNATFLEGARKMVPADCKIPILGRKPDGPGAVQQALKILPIPNSSYSIRFFRGGFPSVGFPSGGIMVNMGGMGGMGMPMFFDFVDERNLAVKKPDDYNVVQETFGGKITLQPMPDVMSLNVGAENQCFAVLEDVRCVLERRGQPDFDFTTSVP